MKTNLFPQTRRPAGKAAANILAFCAAVMVAVLFGLLTAKPAHAATFFVNWPSDHDDGSCDFLSSFSDCTLREAINAANNAPGADTINFNIPDDPNVPGTEVKTISLGSELPRITDTVTIDGYSQQGATANTNTDLAQGSNANLLIELKATSGTGTGTGASGLVVGGVFPGSPQNSVIKGLVINSFGRAGIYVWFDAVGTRVEGNFIGTDPSGTQDRGNHNSGVDMGADGNVIGGTSPAARNVISGNGLTGVFLWGTGVMEGNYIGTKKDGAFPLGNDIAGVQVRGASNAVGGTTTGAGNVIAFNAGDGVTVAGGTGHRILGNSIFSNAGLGIDLGADGVSPNDKTDPDTGFNNLQNFPVLTSVTSNPDGTTTISGKLNSRPRKTFTIQFFSSSAADPSGNGEGKTFLDEITVKTSRKGNRSFTFTTTLPAGENIITATATNNLTGDTSEFSAPPPP